MFPNKNRTGNNHSSLLDQFVKVAQGFQDKNENFNNFVQSIAKKPLKKTAQFNQPPTPDMGPEIGSDPANPIGADGAPPADGGIGQDTEGAKRSLVEALIALCGGPEEAKACIDANQSPEAGELPAEDSAPPEPMEMPAPMPMPM